MGNICGAAKNNKVKERKNAEKREKEKKEKRVHLRSKSVLMLCLWFMF